MKNQLNSTKNKPWTNSLFNKNKRLKKNSVNYGRGTTTMAKINLFTEITKTRKQDTLLTLLREHNANKINQTKRKWRLPLQRVYEQEQR